MLHQGCRYVWEPQRQIFDNQQYKLFLKQMSTVGATKLEGINPTPKFIYFFYAKYLYPTIKSH